METIRAHHVRRNMDIQFQPFIAITLPMGVRSDRNLIAVSCCLNINKYFQGLSQAPYDGFYAALIKLRDALNAESAHITIKGGKSTANMVRLLEVRGSDFPFLFSVPDQAHRLELKEYQDLKKSLWERIFPTAKRTNPQSRVPNPRVGSLVQMTAPNELPYLTDFISKIRSQNSQRTPRGLVRKLEVPDISDRLQRIREFGVATEKRALIEKLEFIAQHYSGELRKQLEDVLKAVNLQITSKGKPDPGTVEQMAEKLASTYQNVLNDYLADNYGVIDIDEVINNFSSLTNEPTLMRLMGLTRDFEITLPGEFVPKPGSPASFYLKVELNNSADILSLPTEIKGIWNNDRYAYLVAESGEPQFFDNSILKVRTPQPRSSLVWVSHLCTFDKIAKELKLKAIAEAKETNSGAIGEAWSAASTMA